MLKRSFLFNLLLILLILVGLVYLFFSSLNWLTNHGKQTFVPNLAGSNMVQAVKILKDKGFRVQIDSTYQGYSKPLEVLYQEPEAGANVKVGRTIFLTVNRKTPPSILMPNLVNLSFRNALLTMQSYRLEMGDTIYKPDVAAGAVLDQLYNGRPIKAGMSIPFGSRIDLVVGEGLSDNINVPNLIGMTWSEAKALLDKELLTINPIWEGEITDSVHAIIYSQQPEAINELDFPNAIPRGDLIDVRVMQSPSQELLLKNQPGSKKLFGNQEQATETTIDTATGAETPAKEVPIGVTHKDSIKKRTEAPKPIKKAKVIEDNQDKISQSKDRTTTAAKKDIKKDSKKEIKKDVPKKQHTSGSDIRKSDDNISNGFD